MFKEYDDVITVKELCEMLKIGEYSIRFDP